jgi:3-oxoacyl-[acyl-carrier-protein] synthase II
MNDKNAVVVTGIGVFSSIGCGRKEFWDSLVNGISGIRTISSFDPEGHSSKIASEVQSFVPTDYIPVKQSRRMARVSQLATSASVLAVKDAGLDLGKEIPERVGCVIGSAAGDWHTIEDQNARFREKGPGCLNPLSIPKIIPNMPACNTAIVLGIHGPNLGVATACATGAHAIGMALGILRQGQADVVLAGGAEATITPVVVDGYASMSVLSLRNNDPQKASRPFDLDRDGFVIGEGAGILVLETIDHAKKRGAVPLAWLSGFGMTSDAYSIAIPGPDGRWTAAAISQAVKDAGIRLEDIGYINAHGTSTKINDKVESISIQEVFKNRKGGLPPVSSNKSMIGHTLGAAGAIEAAATVLSIYHSVLTPTINYETRDPDCDLNIVANEARDSKIRAAISNSFGFGGQNGVLVFSKFN